MPTLLSTGQYVGYARRRDDAARALRTSPGKGPAVDFAHSPRARAYTGRVAGSAGTGTVPREDAPSAPRAAGPAAGHGGRGSCGTGARNTTRTQEHTA
ncbi:hypothetical protein GCM10023079_21400 [Streptomyces chitinivorans]